MVASSKQLVYNCLNGLDPERIPVMLPFQGYYSCIVERVTNSQAISCPELSARAQLHFLDACNIDGMEVIHDGFSPVEACGAMVGESDYLLMPTLKPLVRDFDTIETSSVPDPLEDRRFLASLEQAETLLESAGSEYFTYATLVAPFTLSAELMGIQQLIFATYSEPILADMLIKYSISVVKAYLDEITRLDIDAVFLIDSTSSGSFINQDQYAQFAMPALNDCASCCKRSNKAVMLHVCGKAFDQLKLLGHTNIDIVNVDRPVKLAAISRALPEKIILGNLAPEGALSYGTPYDVADEAIASLQSMKGRRYILGTGCGPSETVKIQNIKMLRYASDLFSSPYLGYDDRSAVTYSL